MLKSVFSSRAFFPVLLSAYPAIHLFDVNYGSVPFATIVLPLILSLSATSALLFLFNRVRVLAGQGPLLVGLFLILFFGYGMVYEELPAWAPIVTPFVRDRFLFPVWAIAGILVAVCIVRRRPMSSPVFLNFGVSCLLGLSGCSILVKQAAQFNQVAGRISVVEANQTYKPDIYYIIQDAYGRSDKLECYYHLNTTDFLSYLRSKGFWIANSSKSNYLQTALSIPSSLNMQYLSNIKPPGVAFDRWYSRPTIAGLMNHPAVFDVAKQLGYTTVNVSSGFELSSRLSGADINLGYSLSSEEFDTKFLSLTMLKPWVKIPFLLITGDQLLERYKLLKESASIKGPKFVFCHILSPHPPYEFDAQGRPTNLPFPEQGWTNRAAYAGQVQYDDDLLRDALGHILDVSKQKPIIIIQGDHGPSLIDSTPTRPWNADWPANQLDVREPILNAYLVPKQVQAELYGSITPVNSFRTIFRSLFGLDLPRLDDKTYYSTAAAPLHLVPVPR